MATKHRLLFSIKAILRYNRDGSFETQKNRAQILSQAAMVLVEAGFKLNHIRGLKPKHIQHLNQHWLSQGLSAGTIKNRNAYLRWLCTKLGKSTMMPDNDALGVPKRQYQYCDKAIELTADLLQRINDPYLIAYVKLQRYLGLRREEALKLKPHLADNGDSITLQASWCKGGRARTVPITSQAARDAIDECKSLVNHTQQSLIPEGKKYITQRHCYSKAMYRLGIKHAHGFRHAYAQARYQTLTGWPCPMKGGPKYTDLTAQQQDQDKEARLQISQELGHARIAITKQYLG